MRRTSIQVSKSSARPNGCSSEPGTAVSMIVGNIFVIFSPRRVSVGAVALSAMFVVLKDEFLERGDVDERLQVSTCRVINKRLA